MLLISVYLDVDVLSYKIKLLSKEILVIYILKIQFLYILFLTWNCHTLIFPV